MIYLIVPLLSLALIIGALADVITNHGRIRHLDKMTWIFIIIFLPLIGSILWFVVGREYDQVDRANRGSFGDPRRQSESFASSTEQQLAALEREIAASEKAQRIARLEAEVRAKREARGR
jgi:hypothetical protein